MRRGAARSAGRDSPSAASSSSASSALNMSPLIMIPLEPSLDTVDDDALHKVLQSEYTCRYLEKIGAKPTRANMELVRRNLPLTKDCLKIQLKTRGSIKDEVSIVLPPVAYDVKPPELSLAPTLKKVLLTSNLARIADDDADDGRLLEDSRAASSRGEPAVMDELGYEEGATLIENSTKEVRRRRRTREAARPRVSASGDDGALTAARARGRPAARSSSSPSRCRTSRAACARPRRRRATPAPWSGCWARRRSAARPSGCARRTASTGGAGWT